MIRGAGAATRAGPLRCGYHRLMVARFPTFAPAVLLLSLAAAAATQTPAPRPSPSPSTDLLDLQREAADLLRQAARAGVTPDEVDRRLADAARHFEALAAGPAIPATLRADLHRAAVELGQPRAGRPEATRPFDARAYLELLDGARAPLQAADAAGLAFQGSHSQSKPKEPLYGGHAS